jgi:hypothetical protein
MKNTNDLDGILVNAVDSQIRQPVEYKFSRIRLAPGPSRLRKSCEHIKLAMDRKRYPACFIWPAMVLNVIAKMSEIVDGRIRPAQLH